MSFDLPKGWTSQSIENAMEAIIDYRGKTPKKSDSGIPLITAKIVKSGRLETPTEFIPEEDYDAWMVRGLPQAGDVVLTTEAPLGEVAQLDDANVALAQRIVTLRGKPDLLVNDYLKYLLQSHAVQQQLDARGSGSTVKGIKQSELRKVVLSLPPIAQQRSIAGTLKSLDDKITLNTQTNQTLEQMAQALFKSWFVDFDPVIDNALDSGFFEREFAGEGIPEPLAKRVAIRQALREAAGADTDASAIGRLPPETRALFPDSFEEHPELGWIPKGWGVESLESMTSEIIDHRGKTPKKLGGDWSLSGYPAISAKNIKGGRIVQPDTIRFVDEDLYKKWMKVPLEKGDLVVTSEAPLGEVYYLSGKHDYLLSQRLYGMRANPEICTGSFLYFWLQTGFAKADIEGRATGTTVVGIRQVELRKVKVLAPNKCIVDLFDKQASLLLEKIEQNQESIYTLSNLRDTLLPKLLSGELTLPEVEVEQDSI
ncbi:restriction endonuclease subunit S [Shewanella algae]|uniref:restriction endonuclease subunit S n=1 Tax=Shewanella algae TaxID=38313 RepID=UPI0031F568DD